MIRISSIILFLLCLRVYSWTPELIHKEKKVWWAYKAPLKTPKPDNEGVWGNNPIDAYIFENLKKYKLTPSDEAGKRELVRRVYFDLIGLPPTYEQVEEFVNDKSENSYERLLEKLLASPRYGERWGRHWLDVSRYADTQGYNFTRSNKYPFAYTYRDYVIRSFNEDKPYNQFIKEQLAADLMNLKGDDKKNLAALGFLTTGERFLNKTDEIINDRIDVTTQAFLAMTVACARCHDHKVDPIPAADYYSLYGVFKSCHEPKLEDLPEIGKPVDQAAFEKYKQDRSNLLKKLANKENEIFEKARKEWPKFVDGVVEYIGHSRVHKKKERRDQKGRALRKGHVEMLKKYISGKEGKEDRFYALLHHVYHRTNEKDIAKLVKDYSSRESSPQALKEALSKKPITKRIQVYEVYRDLLKAAFGKGKDKKYSEVRELVYGKKFNEVYDRQNKRAIVERDERNQLTKIENEIKNLMTANGAPPRAMIVVDKAKPYNPYIFNRGKPHDRGPKVKRRFPQVVSYHSKHNEFKKGSGRLELAEAIADPKNPLTARVIVNRVWQWHFGEGIVTTPSNFGKMGLPPSNLKLLDHLAIWFVENGWSIKKLHKYIMSSAVYMQKSAIREDMNAIDGANKYLWRMNLHRLEWEAMRDSMLQASDSLMIMNGGQPRNILKFNTKSVRSVYGFLDREKIPGALKNFDFPTPQVTCEARIKTVVPQQGLFMMNSQLVTDCSKVIASKLDHNLSNEERIKQLFKKTLSRLPNDQELSKALSFIDNSKDKFNYQPPKVEYGIAYIKEKSLSGFKHFDFYKDKTWKFKGKFPHPKYEYASLRADGGHPGGNFPAVQRITIYEKGSISLKGSLKHPNKKGDGVRAVLFVNGSEVKSWKAHNKTVSTNSDAIEVKSGDIIELAVEPNKNHGFDTYNWKSKILLNTGVEIKEMDMNALFSGKQGRNSKAYGVWDALAQVMLMSNEFLYVD